MKEPKKFNIELSSAEFLLVVKSLEWYIGDHCVHDYEERPYQELIDKLVELSEESEGE